ncbi:MAG: hypothetical protein JNK15_11595 [Planctomycetes bacterium]|nr:hypothetical protein [Planctomycetota bacterium]
MRSSSSHGLFALRLLCLLVAAVPAVRAQANWIERQPAHRPSPRSGHAMVFDSVRSRVVLFGGRNAAATPLGDTWEWDGDDWTQQLPAVSPPAYPWIGMAFDTARGVTVLVGNTGAVWDWNGSTWTQSTTCPGGVGGANGRLRVAYDSVRSRLVVARDTTVVDEWNGTSWSTITSPVALQSWVGESNFTFDPGLGRCVFHVPFTVLSYNPYLAIGWKLWQWDGVTWTAASVGGMSYSTGEAISPCTRIGSLMLYGGYDGYAPVGSQTWRLVGALQQVTTGKSPRGRSGHALCDDPVRGTMLLFGGHRIDHRNQSVLRDDTWQFVVPPIAAHVESYGTGCGVPAPVLDALGGSRPVLGGSVTVTLAGGTTGVAAVALGFSKENTGVGWTLPLPLDWAGMNGCWLLQSGDVPALAMTPGAGFDTLTLAIPNLPALRSAQVYLQAFTPQAAANIAGVAASSGLQLSLGEL